MSGTAPDSPNANNQPDAKDVTTSGEPSLPWKPGHLANRVSYRTRLVQSVLAERVVAGFAPFGLRPGSFTMMALMTANPGSSQIELAKAGGLDKSAIVAILDDLEEKGLAIRGRSKEDRRRNTLFVTSRGEELAAQMAEVALSSERAVREALTAEELQQLLDLLDRAYLALINDTK